MDPLLLPAWMDRLLALQGQSSPELQQRVAALWEQLTPEKQSDIYETELRKIGIGCSSKLGMLVCPTPRHDTPPADTDDFRRERAAAILADVVDFDSAGVLVTLLTDTNPQVRYQAARGLSRVAGRRSSMTETDWQSISQSECEALAMAWQRWLAHPHDNQAPDFRLWKKKV